MRLAWARMPLYEVHPLRFIDCRKVYLGGRDWLRLNVGTWRVQFAFWQEPKRGGALTPDSEHVIHRERRFP
jgi:hypothetical protein